MNRASFFLACAFGLALAATPSGARAQDPPRNDVGSVPTDPDNEQFEMLVKTRSRYRSIADSGGWPEVPDGEAMTPGERYDCARLETLRQRLEAEGYREHPDAAPTEPEPRGDSTAGQDPATAGAGSNEGSSTNADANEGCEYRPELAAAVKDFQHDRYIKIDGIVGGNTESQLAKPVGDVLAKIDYALQRWRANAANMSGEYIVVSIPAFELAMYQGRKEVIRMPVIVGMADWQTPEMSEKLEYIVVNPSWGIPESIAKSEILPKSRKDPGYLDRHNIVRGENGLLTQKPGPQNPLGRLKFMMPNRKDIYLHDTPHQQKFDAPARPFSHGCVRVDKPLELATLLLKDDPKWSRTSIQAAIDSGETQRITLEQPTPVHLLYIPAVASADGRLRVAPDIYDKVGNAHDERAMEPAPTEEDEFLPGWP